MIWTLLVIAAPTGTVGWDGSPVIRHNGRSDVGTGKSLVTFCGRVFGRAAVDSRVIGIVNQLEDHTCKDRTREPMREQVDDGRVLLRLPYYTRKKGTGAGREVDCNFA
ncbi:hypothetical protein GW17_00057673 [Ensete ventricosum]|nr:hypothetical protein GW17_00057673 [Ensete ventricosum]